MVDGRREGELTPICQTYRVRIRYFPYRYWPNVTIAQPHVTVKVINPLVAPDPRGTGELTPHVYRLGYSPEIPALCVWDPVQDQWDSHDYIVDTIVPWTIKWLLFYEDWLDTGIWQGRGRHPELQPSRILTETPVPSSKTRHGAAAFSMPSVAMSGFTYPAFPLLSRGRAASC